MKLGEMTFEDSLKAELIIVPEIEKLLKDKATAKLFNELYGVGKDKKAVLNRVKASKQLVPRLIHEHYKEICVIAGALGQVTPEEIPKLTRGEVNVLIMDLLFDGDLAGFFTSAEALAQAVSSDT